MQQQWLPNGEPFLISIIIKMKTITIVGTGLIGTAFGHGLREQGFFVVGYDVCQTNLNRSLSLGALDATSRSIEQVVEQSAYVILATPVLHIHESITQILSSLPRNAVLFDTGSAKGLICQKVSNHPRRSSFVAAHPMAGSQHSGPQAAHPNLFYKKKVAVCEPELSSPDSISRVLQIFNSLGLEPVFMSTKQHDEIVALVSHLPQLISYLFASLPSFFNEKKSLWPRLASSGFDSISRLAASDASIWLPILMQNKENVVDELRMLNRMIDFLTDSICCNDAESVEKMVQRANSVRHEFDKRHSNDQTKTGLKQLK